MKTSRFGGTNPTLVLPFFSDARVCPARALLAYVRASAPFRGDTTALFIVSCPPYRPAAKDTLARWLRDVLAESGVDVSFKAHSARHAATSKAKCRSLPLDVIRRAAGWTSSSSVFGRFYDRTVRTTGPDFAASVLS